MKPLQSLLIGATGQVGRQMLLQMQDRALPTTRRTDAPAGWEHLDLEQIRSAEDAERILNVAPLRAVLCVGGLTNVDLCEDEEALAYQVNTKGPALLAAAARERALPFVYFSTEYIFDGQDGPYVEEAKASPLNVYGASKWEGEQGVLAAHPEALVLRTAVVYGADVAGKNFLYSLRNKLCAGETMRVVDDQISTPSYNRDVARATEGLLEHGAMGIYHVCGPEVMSRLEFARMAAKELSLPHSEKIEAITTASLGQRAVRPLRAGLRTEKLQREFPQLAIRAIRSALAECGDAIVRGASA